MSSVTFSLYAFQNFFPTLIGYIVIVIYYIFGKNFTNVFDQYYDEKSGKSKLTTIVEYRESGSMPDKRNYDEVPQ